MALRFLFNFLTGQLALVDVPVENITPVSSTSIPLFIFFIPQ